MFSCVFVVNDPATTAIYTLSLHDALPILTAGGVEIDVVGPGSPDGDQLQIVAGGEYAFGEAGVGADVDGHARPVDATDELGLDRKSTRLNSSHLGISYAVFCLKKKNKKQK